MTVRSASASAPAWISPSSSTRCRCVKAYKDSERGDDARARGARPSGVRARAGRPLLARRRDARDARGRSTLAPDNDDWYTAGEPETRALEDFAAVLMRKDPPFDMEYVYSTYLLEAAESEGARVFNRPRAIRDHNEKMAIARFREFIAPTLVTRDAGRHRRLHRRASRRHREAARRHGRHVGVPRPARRPEPQRDRRDGGRTRARAR